MKLPKILGLVLALHLALGAILVGCNSMKKQPPAPADTAAPAALITAPDAPVLNPPAEAASARFHPTRPASDARPGQPFEPAPVVNPYPIVADDTPPPAVREPEPAPGIPYTVVKGDSLNRIAKRHGVTVAALADANNLPRNATLKIGQKLSVPAARPSADKPAAAASGKTHTVLPGENLTVIARKHHTTVATLKSLNGLTGAARNAGQIR
ncbi:MAG: LysM peptidoglycan-binding domain-containing protein, partial [Opitutaceae bacterium]|nr:LysM peptidoglycan-binding domain-containing protein [Opitutaceae bacterium]